MKRTHFLLIALTILACNQSNLRSTETQDTIGRVGKSILTQKVTKEKGSLLGVLIFQADSAFMNQSSFSVLNMDKSVFTTVKSLNGEEPSSSELNGNVLAYYPEYFIIHLKVNAASNSDYTVQVGKEEKIVKKEKYMEFVSWPEYILRNMATTTQSNPLHQEPNESSKQLEGLRYNELSFKCLKVSGDWVQVECNKECEGCVGGKIVSGWIRWKEGNKIILKQKYVC